MAENVGRKKNSKHSSDVRTNEQKAHQLQKMVKWKDLANQVLEPLLCGSISFCEVKSVSCPACAQLCQECR